MHCPAPMITSLSMPARDPTFPRTGSRSWHHAACWLRATPQPSPQTRCATIWRTQGSATSRFSPERRLLLMQRASGASPPNTRILVLAGLKKLVLRAGMEALYFSGAHHLLRPLIGGVGAILTLHHVRPPRADAFQPNRLLEVTPRFLEDVLKGLRSARLDLVTPDEMHRRLSERDFSRRFVCVTFDDGYRDNLLHALPLLRKYEVPFGLYIPTSFPDRAGDLWWLTLEAVVANQSRISLPMDGEDRQFRCETPEAKYEVYEHIYWWLRRLESEDELRAQVRELAARYGVDADAFCRDLCMTWSEIGEMAADPLATIGAHTVN